MREHSVTPIGTGFSQLGIFQVGLIGAPESYARASYHAVHTFWVTGPGAVRRPVRFSWQPVAGVRNTKLTDVPRDKYLFEELKDRLRRWPARFMLMMTIGEEGDALDDPTKPWPARGSGSPWVPLHSPRSPRIRTRRVNASASIPAVSHPASKPPTDPILEARLGAYEGLA